MGQPGAGQLGVAGDGAEGVAHLVGDPGGEPPDGGEPL